VSTPSLDRAIFSHLNDIIFVVLTPYSAIITSRKRKLRELFAVATHAESIVKDAFPNTDAPPTTQAEADFLLANDISQ
jgi:hypothetical protein